MKACVIPVVTRTGTGVQTVTGVVDQDGNAFVGKFVLAISVGALFNTISYQGGPNVTATVWNHGADTGVVGASGSTGDIDQFFAKVVSTGDTSRYSIGDYQPDIFFGGNWQGYAYVSAFRSGELDITYDLNNRGGWGLLLVVLGGDDLLIDSGSSMTSGTYATSGVPTAVLALTTSYAMGAGKAATTGAGSRQMFWGWDAKDTGRGVAGFELIHFGGNSRGQITDRMWTAFSGAAYSGAAYVSAWGASSYTITSGFVSSAIRFAFSGVRSFAGAANLRTTVGTQVINLGIAARWVKIVTVGIQTSAVVDTTQAQYCVGWADGVNQGCAWMGETQSGHPITGTRYITSGTVVRISPGAAANLTTFSVVANVSDLDPVAGTLTLNVTATDGTPYEILIFALGDAMESPVRPVVYGTTAPAWTLNRFDQKIRVEGPNADPPARAPGRPRDWVPDGIRWKLGRFDMRTRDEETA